MEKFPLFKICRLTCLSEKLLIFLILTRYISGKEKDIAQTSDIFANEASGEYLPQFGERKLSQIGEHYKVRGQSRKYSILHLTNHCKRSAGDLHNCHITGRDYSLRSYSYI
jgi:hypothetical protein